jgi:parallel beta-helix repeat protein
MIVLFNIALAGQSAKNAIVEKNVNINLSLNPNGTTWYVGGDGPGNFTRIFDAIDAASEGDTIFVFSGSYIGGFTILKSVILMGEDKETTEIIGGWGLTVRVNADNVIIHGFTIDSDLDSSHARQHGIQSWCDNTTAYDNIFKSNTTGILLGYSNYNSVFNNTFYGSGITLHSSYDNNIHDNIVNGKKLEYLEDESDKIIDPDTGQVILVNCTNITVRDLDLSRANAGVQLLNTNNCHISGNIISEGVSGISLSNSSGNTISGNNISYCQYDDGIKIDSSSSNNLINGNILMNNSLYGVGILDSCNNTVSDNLVKNNYIGISCRYRYASDNVISNNIIKDNEECGIILDSSCNIACDNVLSDNQYGGIQVYSRENQIMNNTFHNDGLYLEESYYPDNNIIEDNTINGRPLVYLRDVSNRAIDNAGQVILVNCKGITIKNQKLNNTIIGISLTKTRNCHISENEITSNKIFGIRIFDSDRNTITRNIISQNGYYGIFMTRSNRNTISSNHISDNDKYGIYIYDYIEWGWEFPLTSKHNSIIKNNIMNNKESDATFLNSIFNKWRKNFWNDSETIHRVNGEIYLERGWHFGSPPPIEMEVSCLDWMPAREPYNI